MKDTDCVTGYNINVAVIILLIIIINASKLLSIACLVACLGVLRHVWCYGEFIINLHIIMSLLSLVLLLIATEELASRREVRPAG